MAKKSKKDVRPLEGILSTTLAAVCMNAVTEDVVPACSAISGVTSRSYPFAEGG